jgi:WhiB family redox-sensing transcriptional regulator
MTNTAQAGRRYTKLTFVEPGWELSSPDWRDYADCQDEDPELFFPDFRDEPAVTAAKRVCWRCPVRAACLRWAFASKVGDGIFGGLTPEERGRYRAGGAA